MGEFGSHSRQMTTGDFFGYLHEVSSHARLVFGEKKVGQKSDTFAALLRRAAQEGHYLLQVGPPAEEERQAPMRVNLGGTIELDDPLW